MDPVYEIKARLPIDELVGQYCALQKHGRHFKCLCPFHNDSHPSMLVSPDKGIAFCFSCSNGGDIFSFYQKIEGVDFRQALKDLGEKTGVDVSDVKTETVKKDVKDRLRDCLESAQSFYAECLQRSAPATEYLKKRGVPDEQIGYFGLGYAPDSFSETYEHLLRAGFSKSEVLQCGLGVQKELKEEKIYDRFRNRIMFPIHDAQGKLVAFGGRTLGEADAKYINSSEGPLYHKSSVLYGFHQAKELMRESKKAVIVEGYFDVLACHRVGIGNVVAAGGTAFTLEHAKLLKRHAETVVLCLDQDTAGRQAAERAYYLCCAQDLQVHAAVLPAKDPDETAAKEPGLLEKILREEGRPYLDIVLDALKAGDVSSATGKREALKRMLPLIGALQTAVEQSHYIGVLAGVLGTTETALKEDLQRVPPKQRMAPEPEQDPPPAEGRKHFSSMEIALALLLLYPAHRHLLERLIPPEGTKEGPLYYAIKEAAQGAVLTPDSLTIPEEYRERVGILLLYLEQHGMADWSEGIALLEIRKNCVNANRDFIQRQQKDIARRLMLAKAEGRTSDEAQLSTQYQQILKLARMAL